MSTGAWVTLAIVAVVVIVVLLLVARRRRSAALRDRFGPEYERAVEQEGGRRAAEADLQARQERREHLNIRPLDPEARERYAESWREVQAHFVNDPGEAAKEAHALVIEVMRDRGYPIDDFEQRAADISVDHPQVVDDYRAAHQIARSHDAGEAGTEDLRRAMVHYRSLFEELLEARGSRR